MREPIRPLLGLDPAAVVSLPAEALPGLLTALAAFQTAVAARLAVLPPMAAPSPPPTEPEQRWLTVRQAAARVGKDDRYVYRKIHAVKDPWPFTKDGKTVLIDALALDERLERNRRQNGVDVVRRGG